ncbi:MAG: transglycosylase domain-containing protein [Actinomycetota bacterium]
MQAPPKHRSPAAPSREDARFRIPRAPLVPLLFASVIAVAAGLVALVLLPVFGAMGLGVNSLNERLGIEGATFTQIPHFPERSTIYASDGSVLATIYLDENRQIVRLRNVSDIAQKAVLAIEDDAFYEHGAINVPSVIRAMLANLVAGRITQGGSTITQQLVKNVVIENAEQTFARKFQEAALAIRLEQEYTKDQILELYLNDVYFGNGIYGIGTAARFYFQKPASELNLPESALLAGMVAAPETYDPLDRPQAATSRRNDVLDRLAELGWVPQEDVDRAKAGPIRLPATAGQREETVEPFFVYYLKKQILDMENREFDAFGKTYNQRLHRLFQGGLKIYTTLDPDWQRYAEEAVYTQPWVAPGAPDAGLATVDVKTGAIRTMFSGRNYEKNQKDLVWLGRRQPGSAFKPFTLVAAFRRDIPPGKVYSSQSPIRLEGWNNDCHCVTNAEGAGDRGYMDLWAATQGSVNVVFAQLVLDVGPENVVQAAHDMGITAPLDAVPSITLGAEEVSPLEMASGFATLANEGKYCEPFAVARVELPGGKKLYQHKAKCEQVISPEIAHLVTAMLQRVVTGGTGTAAALGRPVAGKTGTSQDYTNVWFAGYTPQESTAVWVGFRQGQIPLDTYFGGSVFGGTIAAPIWHDYMSRVMRGFPVLSFPAPPPPESGTIPDVVGLLSEEAEEALAEANFTPKIQMVHSLEPKDTVAEQTPKGGSGAVLGSLVTIKVSDGIPPQNFVPDVVGLKEADAVARIEAKLFVVKVRRIDVIDPALDGIVLAQTPAGRVKAAEGSKVLIEVGRFRPAGGRPNRI